MTALYLGIDAAIAGGGLAWLRAARQHLRNSA